MHAMMSLIKKKQKGHIVLQNQFHNKVGLGYYLMVKYAHDQISNINIIDYVVIKASILFKGLYIHISTF